MTTKRGRMPTAVPDAPMASLLHLPDTALVAVLSNLDAAGLSSIAQASRYFVRKDPVTGLPLTQHIARQQVISRCDGSEDAARRFK